MIEQPIDSLFFEYPVVKQALKQTGGHITTTYQCYFGSKLLKGTIIGSNIPIKLMKPIAKAKPKGSTKPKQEGSLVDSYWKTDKEKAGPQDPTGQLRPPRAHSHLQRP
eukprot:2650249-Pyramimonas_sp.AAC.1